MPNITCEKFGRIHWILRCLLVRIQWCVCKDMGVKWPYQYWTPCHFWQFWSLSESPVSKSHHHIPSLIESSLRTLLNSMIMRRIACDKIVRIHRCVHRDRWSHHKLHIDRCIILELAEAELINRPYSKL